MVCGAIGKIVEDNHRRAGVKPIEFKIIDGCWECTSHTASDGRYTNIYREGKKWKLHRYLFTLLREEIPAGMVLLHSCDNTKCVNPLHMSIGTQRDNMYDMVKKGRGKLLGFEV
jgi:hypothetical protein